MDEYTKRQLKHIKLMERRLNKVHPSMPLPLIRITEDVFECKCHDTIQWRIENKRMVGRCKYPRVPEELVFDRIKKHEKCKNAIALTKETEGVGDKHIRLQRKKQLKPSKHHAWGWYSCKKNRLLQRIDFRRRFSLLSFFFTKFHYFTTNFLHYVVLSGFF